MLQPHTINLLKRLGERVVQNHQEYDQSNWGQSLKTRGEICHTPACFAGHLCIMVDGEIPDTMGNYLAASDRATEILGINEDQQQELFMDYTPFTYEEAMNRKKHLIGSLEYAQRAQKFLNEWIEKETRA